MLRDPDSDLRPAQDGARWSGLRLVLAVSAGAAVLGVFLLVAYEVALARVPQHRAALERLVRAQTGLDVHFNELGLRWGWYGPEAVFRRVELGEPGTSRVLLRAPELVVGFDAWRTLRSGHPEAGRIELIAPDIDFAGEPASAVPQGVGVRSIGGPRTGPEFDRAAVLQRWRGGRIDLDGGTLRLPDPGGSANPFILQIRRASLRRSDEEWSIYGLVFLPDRLGRMARVVMRVTGDLSRPAALSGSLRLEARRVLFGGCREAFVRLSELAAQLPRSGSGDVTLDVDFAAGAIVKASGTLRAADLVFGAPKELSAQELTGAPAQAAAGGPGLLKLGRLAGEWRLARHGSDWRLRVDSLELGPSEPKASLTLDAGLSGQWVRGSVQYAPLGPLIAVARWLTLPLDLADVRLKGRAREVGFDWNEQRRVGERLRLTGQLDEVALVPESGDFSLSGFEVQVTGTESLLTARLRSTAAHLELAQSRQYPLEDVRIASTLRIGQTPTGWLMSTDGFALEHEHARLSLSGTLRQEGVEGSPTINAHGRLIGADIGLVERLLGDSTAQAFGAAASRLTAGRISHAEFGLRGPIAELPFGGHGDGFTGSLTLQDAIVSGGDLWPDAEALEARVDWRGARIQATISAGHASSFGLAAAHAQWDAAGQGPTRLTGRITGRLEDAVAWIAGHPRLQQFAPQVQNVAARGEATFDFAVSIPSAVNTATSVPTDSPVREPTIQARVVTSLQQAEVSVVPGLPPIEALSGSFVFDGGRLQHSLLSGTWLGGPVTLRVGELSERATKVFAIQAQGVFNAQQIASTANAPAQIQGNTDWTGELRYVPAVGSQSARWRMRADSNLLGVLSTLPEPLEKRPGASLPAHLVVAGDAESAELRFSLGDRLRSAFALRRGVGGGWVVGGGSLRLDTVAAVVPARAAVLVQGHVGRLDLPAYVAAWQRLRWDSLPPVQAQIATDELLLAGQSYRNVSLEAVGSGGATELQLQSDGVAGEVSWPVAASSSHAPSAASTVEPAVVHLTRLSLVPDASPAEEMGLIAALAPVTRVSVDDLLWQGRSLGQLTATLVVQRGLAVADDLRLAAAAHTAHGALHCQTEAARCDLTFMLESTDAAATLQDFGFRPDLTADEASLGGELQWRMRGAEPWLQRVEGTVKLRVADGSTRNPQPEVAGRPFALFSVPALLQGLGAAERARAALPQPLRELHFAQLEADFQLGGGEARTSDLHFDGDAEILIRGATGLLARDYDQQVWILRGEDRLPEAIRRFGATPRVAAAWLSLRELFEGGEDPERSRAGLRLQGSWDDPMVTAAN